MSLADSGARTEFMTGAMREIDEVTKGRCDLLPLDVVADILAVKGQSMPDPITATITRRVTMEPLKTLKTKLTSRKFWAAVVGIVSGLAMIFRLDEGTISTFTEAVMRIGGLIMTFGSVLGYIVTEGRIDKTRLDNETAKDAIKGSTTETEFNDKGEVTKTTTHYE